MSVTHEPDTRREAIRRTLAQRAGDPPEARAVVEATLSTWHDIASRLAPVIGRRGVEVLFRRSLHLTSDTFPLPVSIGEDETSASLVANFRSRLASREQHAAAEAGYTVLVTFTDLLATRSGDALTERLLSPVWAPPPAQSKKEATA